MQPTEQLQSNHGYWVEMKQHREKDSYLLQEAKCASMATVVLIQGNFPLKIGWRRDKLYKRLVCLALKTVPDKFMEKTLKNLYCQEK